MVFYPVHCYKLFLFDGQLYVLAAESTHKEQNEMYVESNVDLVGEDWVNMSYGVFMVTKKPLTVWANIFELRILMRGTHAPARKPEDWSWSRTFQFYGQLCLLVEESKWKMWHGCWRQTLQVGHIKVNVKKSEIVQPPASQDISFNFIVHTFVTFGLILYSLLCTLFSGCPNNSLKGWSKIL